ncbi:unnamed protein product [Pieris macdunnoughi]|uniref:Histone-lysine N-methyltransferase SETMAR n=1 Tax=Pieris macdunnoughi TaxID=345717 RepID=A0A821Y0N8_9NEOP|nr:unnamed protein product [Pieris macdunnoughi]
MQCHKSMGFELEPHPPHSPASPSDFSLFSDLKRILVGQKFCSDEEVNAETDAYFETTNLTIKMVMNIKV